LRHCKRKSVPDLPKNAVTQRWHRECFRSIENKVRRYKELSALLIASAVADPLGCASDTSVGAVL